MPSALGYIEDWLFRPSDLENIAHMAPVTLFTWLDNCYDGQPDWAYTGQLTRPSFAVIATLDASIPYDFLYGLYIPQISADDEGNVTFNDGLVLTSPDAMGVQGTLATVGSCNGAGEPEVIATSSGGGETVVLRFTAAFQAPPSVEQFPSLVACQLIITASSQYAVPPAKVTPINR